MNIDQLIYFVKIAKTLNISKASDELFITESALSKSLSRMESELQNHLFYRVNNHLVLTEYGRFFEKHANQIVLEWNKITNYNEHNHSITICSNDVSILQNAVGFFINSYDKKDNSSDIKDFLLPIAEIENLFNRNECDISFTIGNITANNIISLEYKDYLSVVYHKSVVDTLPSLASLESLPFNEYITLGSSGPISSVLKSYRILHNFKAKINYQYDSAIFINKIANTNTPAILTSIAARKLDKDIFGIVDLSDKDLEIPVSITIKKEKKELEKHIIQLLENLKVI